MPRLFIATPVEPTPGMRRVLRVMNELQGGRAPVVRSVRADQLHVTYRFLGDVDEPAADEVEQALASADWTRFAPIAAQFEQLGRFPPIGKRMRVIYAQPDEASTKALSAIASRVDVCLDAVDDPMPARDRPFTSHVTLARVNPRRRMPAMVEHALQQLLKNPLKGEDAAVLDRIMLVESTLGPQGPDYQVRWETVLHG